METSGVNELITRMEDALPHGNIYHITYLDSMKRTDAYYARHQEMIKFLEDHHDEALKNLTTSPKTNRSQESLFQDFVGVHRKRLLVPKEYINLVDYNLDGAGFVMKQQSSFLGADGKRGTDGPTIYASDGKIMGTFYSDAQAVVQPATERPVSERAWDTIAYYFFREKISSTMMKITGLAVTRNEKELVIAGEIPHQGLGRAHLELRIDNSTFRPVQMICINYNSLGKLYQKAVKTWQFQDFAGFMMPKQVVEQTYYADLKESLNLEEEETFTINEFSPQVQSSKERLKELLKSNYSVYDEITGSHYISGNPEGTLDKLSR